MLIKPKALKEFGNSFYLILLSKVVHFITTFCLFLSASMIETKALLPTCNKLTFFRQLLFVCLHTNRFYLQDGLLYLQVNFSKSKTIYQFFRSELEQQLMISILGLTNLCSTFQYFAKFCV